MFVLTRATFFVGIRPWDEKRHYTHFVQSDGAEYYWTARNLLDGRGYSDVPRAPYPPAASRTPLYPLFLAATIKTLGDGVAKIVELQMAIQALTIALIYVGSRLLFTPFTAFWLTALCILDPVYLVMSGLLYTETLYQVINVVFAYLLVRGLRDGFSVVRASLMALCLGLCLLTRPFMLYYLPVVALLVCLSEATLGGGARKAALVLALVFAVLAPWLYRNGRVFGTWSMSSVDGASVRSFMIAPFLAEREGRPLEEVRARLAAETPPSKNPFDGANFAKRQALDVIRAHPVEYVRFHFSSTLPMLVGANSEGLAFLLSPYGAGSPNRQAPPPPPERAYLGRVVVAANLLLLAALYTTFVVGVWTLWERREFLLVVLLVSVVLYLVGMTGPMSSSRYRLNIVPFLLFGAGVGIQRLEARFAREPRVRERRAAIAW